MVTIHTLTEKAIAVTGLPDGACDFEICTNINTGLKFMVYDGKTNTPYKELLPEGNWRILGFSNDLTEDDWKRVVEKMPWGEANYKNYGLSPWLVQYVGLSPSESGHSLLKAKGLHVTNPLMSEKPITVIGHKGQEKICELILNKFQEQWQSAELLTNPLILIQ